jgi:hypothetical protein
MGGSAVMISKRYFFDLILDAPSMMDGQELMDIKLVRLT